MRTKPKDTYDGTGRHELRHDGRLYRKGDETDCYAALHRLQSQSWDWAMKHEGWTIEPIATQ